MPKDLPVKSFRQNKKKLIVPKRSSKNKLKHHFLPNKETGARATLLSNYAFLTYCIILFCLFSAFKLIPTVYPGVLGYASNIHMEKLLEQTNKKRAEQGLEPLKLNSKLSVAAQKKAQDMFAKNYWAHVSPDNVEPWDFILSEQYDYSYAGENLAKNFENSEEVVEAWYESPSHKENLLNSNYNEVGFAIVDGTLNGYETTLVVQMFGKLRTPSYVATNDSVTTENAPVIPEVPITNSAPAVNSSNVGYPEPIPASLSNARKPLVDIGLATNYLNLFFGGFVVSLFGLDVLYSAKHSIKKTSGHSFTHLAFLLIMLIGVWVSLSPGKII